MLPGLFNNLQLGSGAAVTPEAPAAVTEYIASYSGVGVISSQTVSIGTAFDDRIVIVVMWASNGASSTISNLKLDTTSMSTVVQYNTGYSPAVIAQVAFPTGTTAKLYFTLSGGADYYGISVYTLRSYQSATPVWTGSQYINSARTATLTTTGLTTGFAGVFSFETYRQFTASPWTTSNVTQDTLITPQGTLTTASLNGGLTGDQTVSGTWSGTNTPAYSSMLGAVWR